MTTKFFICSITLTILFISFSIAANAQWAIMKSDADSLVRRGADYIYNVEFDQARACFNKVIQLYPKDPAGYFLDAMIEWWRIVLYPNDTRYEKAFLDKIEKVVAICDAILDSNLADINALFFKGGALGYRGRFFAQKKNWVPAADNGQEAYSILMRCMKIAPGNHDIMLGTGIYNYFAQALTESYPILKPIMRFFPKGDKEIGILQLRAASNNARYASVEARVVLLQLLYQFERNYREALNVALELQEKYPNNSYFKKYAGRCYAALGDLANQETVWRDVLNNFIDKKPGYDNNAAREALYYVGAALMERRELEMALRYFYKCDEASRLLDRDGPSGFMVQTNMRIGKIFDLQGKRKYAVMQYEKVLKMKESGSSHDEARRYLNNPYR